MGPLACPKSVFKKHMFPVDTGNLSSLASRRPSRQRKAFKTPDAPLSESQSTRKALRKQDVDWVLFMLIPFLCNADFDTTIKPIAGIFMDDYPNEIPKKLLNNILIYNNFKNKEKEKKLDSILANLKPNYKNAKGKSLQNLIKDLGKIEILNLKKGSD